MGLNYTDGAKREYMRRKRNKEKKRQEENNNVTIKRDRERHKERTIGKREECSSDDR